MKQAIRKSIALLIALAMTVSLAGAAFAFPEAAAGIGEVETAAAPGRGEDPGSGEEEPEPGGEDEPLDAASGPAAGEDGADGALAPDPEGDGEGDQREEEDGSGEDEEEGDGEDPDGDEDEEDDGDPDAELTRADLEEAVVELAWAYFLKGARVQYDSTELSYDILRKFYGGMYRITEGVAPEYGSSHTAIFTVCSDYVWNVYYNALEYPILGHPLNALTSGLWMFSEQDEPFVVLRWWSDSYNGTGELDELDLSYGMTDTHRVELDEAVAFLADWENNLRPGDILVTDDHTMLYIGEGYLLDSWGGKYNMSTGLDVYEGSGSVATLHTVEAVYLDGTDPVARDNYRLWEGATITNFGIVRPLDLLVEAGGGEGHDPGADPLRGEYGIADATRSRLEYRGLGIDRTVDITPFGTAEQGGTLTYSIEVANRSNNPSYTTYHSAAGERYTGTDYEGLVVTELVPEGTSLIESSVSHAGAADGDSLTWTLDLAAGESATLRYTVRVDAPMGETLIAEGGWVADIPSNTITNRVGGGKLDGEHRRLLGDFYSQGRDNWVGLYGLDPARDTGTAFAERVYAQVLGLELELPAVEDILRELFEVTHIQRDGGTYIYHDTPKEAWLYRNREWVDGVYGQVQAMVVDGYYGGQGFYVPTGDKRVNEFDTAYLEPGDILIYTHLSPYPFSGEDREVQSHVVAVYLGDDRFAAIDSDGTLYRYNSDSILWKAFTYDFFTLLRPSQAYADIGGMATGEGPVDPGEGPGDVETKQARQDAVVATAWAYYNKGEGLQRDGGTQLTGAAAMNGGNERATVFVSPEYITSQTSWYGNTGGLLLSVYYDALGYKLADHAWQTVTSRFGSLVTGPVAAYSWTGGAGEALLDAQEYRAMLEPGDIVFISGSSTVYGLYLGEDRMLNVTGETYNYTAGVERFEAGGAGQIQALSGLVDDALLWSATEIYICRVVDAMEYDEAMVSAAAEGRVRYPGLVIDRTVDVSPYGSAALGGELTYTVAVTNGSDEDCEELLVTETVPELTALRGLTGGGWEEEGNLYWTLHIPAGETAMLSYTVSVTDDPDAMGLSVENGGGTVGGIPSNTLANTVGGRGLGRGEREALAALAEDFSASDWTGVYGNLAFAVEVYDRLGLDIGDAFLDGEMTVLNLFGVDQGWTDDPDIGIFVRERNPDGSFVQQATGTTTLRVLQKEFPADYRTAGAMLVDGYFGGYRIYTPQNTDRILEFSPDYLEPGDILVKISEDSRVTWTSVYLGDGLFIQSVGVNGSNAANPAESVSIVDCREDPGILWDVFRYDAGNLDQSIRFFCLLRPSQAYEQMGGGEDAVEVESIRIDAGSMVIMRVGDTRTLEAIIAPGNATDRSVTWTSSNERIAVIDEDSGELTVVGQGMCQITATSSNGKTHSIYISAS